MPSGYIIQQLQSELGLLQVQLEDVNEMINLREDELHILRKKAAHAAALQSRLDINLDEFYQMQDHIGNQQQYAEGAVRREAALETELLQSLGMESQFYNLKRELASTKTALADISEEMDRMPAMHKEIAILKARIAELESNQEIAILETAFLKEELEEYRLVREPVKNKDS